jgi:hypothetical protein
MNNENAKKAASEKAKNVLSAVARQQGPGGPHATVRLLSRNLAGNKSLTAPAFLNAPGTLGRRALMHAAHIGDFARLTQLLAGHANPNLADQRGFTPLIYAANAGHVPCVLALLQGGANPNLGDERGFTPLMHAVGKGHIPCIQVLLQGGADPNLAAHQGEGAQEFNDLAVRNGYTAVVLAALRGDAQIVGMLQEAGASLVLPNGRTVIRAACLGQHEIGDEDIKRLREVLHAGIPITPEDIEGAFHINEDNHGGGSPYQFPFIRVLMQGLIRQVPDREARLAVLTAANIPYGEGANDVVNNTIDNPEVVLQEPNQQMRQRKKRKSTRRRKPQKRRSTRK